VVNVMSYGAFVKLEEASRAGAYQRDVVDAAHQPSQRDRPGRRRDRVVVLKIDKEKHEISLGMKQTQENPGTVWPTATRRGPSSRHVRNLTNYGAFIEIEEGIDVCCTSATCRGPARSPSNEMVERPRAECACSRSTRSAVASPWA